MKFKENKTNCFGLVKRFEIFSKKAFYGSCCLVQRTLEKPKWVYMPVENCVLSLDLQQLKEIVEFMERQSNG